VSAEREEESEQEEQAESPSSASPVVIVIQPNVQIHMPEGSMMQRPEQSESESEFEQRPDSSMKQPERETEKGEEEQMDRPPSSLAAPMSLRQSAIKVALMRRKVMMLESKLSALRSKLAGDSSLALPIARARRQLVKAKLGLAIAERRHRLLRHQKLKEHEAKLMKLKLGQTAETTHFDTQGQLAGGGVFCGLSDRARETLMLTNSASLPRLCCSRLPQPSTSSSWFRFRPSRAWPPLCLCPSLCRC